MSRWRIPEADSKRLMRGRRPAGIPYSGRGIALEVFDAGTIARVEADYVPGMDRLTWIEAESEEDAQTGPIGIYTLNAAMRDAWPRLDVRPWPDPVPRHAPVDWTERYAQFRVDLHQLEQYSGDFAERPIPSAYVWRLPAGPQGYLWQDHHDARAATVEEVKEAAEVPNDWIRLPFANEAGGTNLKEAWTPRFYAPLGTRYVPVVPDNDLFTPFDLRHPEWYGFKDDDGRDVEAGEEFCSFSDGSRVSLYLRPRRWRWFVLVIAHYLYLTPFEEALNDEFFPMVFFGRPPFHPVRHNIAVTKDPATWDLQNYYGEPRGFDQGINDWWDLSQHSIEMREEILEQQFYSLCVAYVFIGNEYPDITIWRDPPRQWEYVAGIGRYDSASGQERRVWVVQHADVSEAYPRTIIGQFLATWQA